MNCADPLPAVIAVQGPRVRSNAGMDPAAVQKSTRASTSPSLYNDSVLSALDGKPYLHAAPRRGIVRVSGILHSTVRGCLAVWTPSNENEGLVHAHVLVVPPLLTLISLHVENLARAVLKVHGLADEISTGQRTDITNGKRYANYFVNKWLPHIHQKRTIFDLDRAVALTELENNALALQTLCPAFGREVCVCLLDHIPWIDATAVSCPQGIVDHVHRRHVPV
mmetsp:Transcript_37502/g.104243  ORF Transcript_37502/g.104243 Transcript_37502/m.104243 type:complete len:223 (+) Transcript_37502:68-736(+)